MDPRHVLASRSDRAAGEEAERPHHLRQARRPISRARARCAAGRRARRALAARCASASHSTQRCARKSSPGVELLGQRLVAAIAVVADAAAADEGARRRRPPRPAPPTSDRVARIRLSRSACLRAADQRPPAIDSPARLITAAAPSSSRAQAPRMSVGRPADTGNAGLAGAGLVLGLPGGRDRVSTRTSWLSSAHAQARALPRNPVPPAMTTFMCCVGRVGAPVSLRDARAL